VTVKDWTVKDWNRWAKVASNILYNVKDGEGAAQFVEEMAAELDRLAKALETAEIECDQLRKIVDKQNRRERIHQLQATPCLCSLTLSVDTTKVISCSRCVELQSLECVDIQSLECVDIQSLECVDIQSLKNEAANETI
jgi:hypothetical protein